MTTVCYRDRTLASDSLAAYGDNKVPGAMQKLFRLKSGAIAGMTGSEGEWRRVLEWLEDGKSEPQPKPNGDSRATVIVLNPDGVLELFEDGYHFIETSEFMAWGSGQAAALGALHAGKTAEEAVKIAALIDKSTGGDVQVMRADVAQLRVVE